MIRGKFIQVLADGALLGGCEIGHFWPSNYTLQNVSILCAYTSLPKLAAIIHQSMEDDFDTQKEVLVSRVETLDSKAEVLAI